MKPLVAVVLLVGGAAVALATVALHPFWWGLLLGVVATAASLWALPAGWWLRTAYGVGWALLVGYASVPRSEGDYVIAADLNGYALLVFALAVLTFSVATLPRPVRADAGNRTTAS